MVCLVCLTIRCNISIYPYDSGELQDYMNPSDPSYQLGGGWTLVCLALLLQLLFR